MQLPFKPAKSTDDGLLSMFSRLHSNGHTLEEALNPSFAVPAAKAGMAPDRECETKRIPMLDWVRKKTVVSAGRKGYHRVSPPGGAANGSRNPAKHSGSCP